MTVELKIPEVGESVTEAIITRWLKAEGDRVEKDEPVAELETDKVDVELPSPASGVIASITAKEGDAVPVGAVIGTIEEGDGAAASQRRGAEEAAGRTREAAGAQGDPDRGAASARSRRAKEPPSQGAAEPRSRRASEPPSKEPPAESRRRRSRPPASHRRASRAQGARAAGAAARAGAAPPRLGREPPTLPAARKKSCR